MKYLVVYKHPRNDKKYVCDNGKAYAHYMTALRHLHLHKVKNPMIVYEVMAIPASYTKRRSSISMWAREDEEVRKEILESL